MHLKIVYYPNKILRTKVDEVKEFSNDKLNKIIKEMSRIMIKYDGVGLAANQVNLNMRLIIINTKDGPKDFINPKIKSKSLIRQKLEEGCLSFPNIAGYINRPKNIIVEYQDKYGKKSKIRAKKLLATIFQHEIDHLNGIIFTDRMKKFTAGEDKFKKLQIQAKKDER